VSWSWTFASRTAGSLTDLSTVPPAKGFPTQGEAETWIGEVWRDLLAEGVDEVTLWEEGREVYGPMSLHPPTP
jgi:hypothetical protein